MHSEKSMRFVDRFKRNLARRSEHSTRAINEPTTLTTPQFSTEEAKAALLHNSDAAKVPLFALPNEILLIIYDILVGSKRIHVFPRTSSRGYHVGISVCGRASHGGRDKGDDTDRIDDDNLAKHARRLITVNEPFSWPWRHAQCLTGKSMFGPTPPPILDLDLSFLLTCSRIYKDASLLPFKSNCFSFSNDAMMRAFCTNLIPAQTAAIESILLLNSSETFMFDRIWTCLGGLRKLYYVNLDKDRNARRKHLTKIWSHGNPVEGLVRGPEHCIELNTFRILVTCEGRNAVLRRNLQAAPDRADRFARRTLEQSAQKHAQRETPAKELAKVPELPPNETTTRPSDASSLEKPPRAHSIHIDERLRLALHRASKRVRRRFGTARSL